MMAHLEQAQAKLLAAQRTLESLGYTYSVGSSMGGVWEPPKGSLPENDVGYPPGPADRFIVRAFYERTEIPGVFHPGYPESAPTFAVNVMARAAQLQASEGGSTDEAAKALTEFGRSVRYIDPCPNQSLEQWLDYVWREASKS